MSEKKQIEDQTSHNIKKLENKIDQLVDELETAKRQIAAAISGANVQKDMIEEKIVELETKLKHEREDDKVNTIIVKWL